MNKEEMQRFLDEEAAEGKKELETMRKLLRVLGLTFPGEKEPDRENAEVKRTKDYGRDAGGHAERLGG